MHNSTFFNNYYLVTHNKTIIFAEKNKQYTMKKGILMSLLVAMTLFFGMPAYADIPRESTYEQQIGDNAKVSVNIQNSAIVVKGAAGYDMEIISLTGRRMMKVRIENNSQRIELNVMKGCYIVKIENQSKKDCFVRKVTIQ